MGERRGAQVEEARALRGDELGDAVALLALELRALVAESARLAQHLPQPREPRVLGVAARGGGGDNRRRDRHRHPPARGGGGGGGGDGERREGGLELAADGEGVGLHVLQLLDTIDLGDNRLEGEESYRWLLVMDRAHHDLSDAVSHNQMAGRNQKQVAEILYQLVGHLKYLNEECGRIHGDIKPRNIVLLQLGTALAWVLIDLDASCEIGSLAGQKVTSSAFLSPEMARQQLAPPASKADLVTASVQLEMWAFGVVLHQLCTTDGETLWHANQADNIGDDQLRQLARHWEKVKAAKMSKIVWHQAAHLAG